MAVYGLQELQGIGDEVLVAHVFTDIHCKAASLLLRLYSDLRPSPARAPQMQRDLRFLVAFFTAQVGSIRLPPTTSPSTHTRDVSARVNEQRVAEIERSKLKAESAILALMSLLALHAAPARALLPLLQHMVDRRREAQGGAPDWASDDSLAAVHSGDVASQMCLTLQLDALAWQPTSNLDPLQVHARLQAAAETPLPDSLSWDKLLLPEHFPLRELPRLIIDALRRRAAPLNPSKGHDGANSQASASEELDRVTLERLLDALSI